MPAITDLSEKEIIEKYFNRDHDLSENYLGIGDDCAAIRMADGWQLVTTDVLIEQTHFKLNLINPRDLGYKAVAVNFSDVAAMAGRPNGLFVSIALPGHLDSNWLQDFSDGLFGLCNVWDVPIFGGDTVSSKQGLALSLTVLGEVDNNSIRFREGAKPSDVICVTGPLGDSAAGLRIEMDDQLSHNKLSNDIIQILKKRHYRPPITLDFGSWLGTRKEVHAMMDISDGLTSDIPEIIKHNTLGANIKREQLPMSAELQSFAASTRYSAFQLAEDGGEDYQLLFTVGADQFEQLKEDFQKKFDSSLYQIGTITDEHDDLLIFQNSQRVRKNPVGFYHFAK